MKTGSGKSVMKLAQRYGRATQVAALAAASLVTIDGCASYADWRDENKGIQLEALKTAPGLKVSVFATDLPKAREMALSTNGTLFVGSNADNVYALTLNGGHISKRRTILTGITDPSGIAPYKGALYVSARTKIMRFDDIENRLDNPPAPVTVVDGFPDKQRHGAHYMAFGPDGKLYISVRLTVRFVRIRRRSAWADYSRQSRRQR